MNHRAGRQGEAPGACIAPGAFIASGAVCHAWAWIGPNVTIGTGSVIGPGSVVGYGEADPDAGPVRIGEGVHVGPNVHIEPGVTLEQGCRVGTGAVLRAGTTVGRGAAIGPGCLVMGECLIGEYVNLLAEVHVCEMAVLESHCQLMPGVVLLNDAYPPTALDRHGPTIGSCAIVGVKALIYPGVTLGYHAMVSALSVVKRDVGDYRLVRGDPAGDVCDVRRIRMKVGDKWVFPYPWMRHGVGDEDITHPAP